MHAISSTPSPADVKEPACTFAFVHEYYSAGEHASGHAAWKPTNICANVQRSRASPVGLSRTALSLLNTFRQGEKIDLTSLQITQLSWTTLSTRDAPNWTSSRAQARKVVETYSLSLDMDTSTTDPHLPEATTGSSWVQRISSSDSRSASYLPTRAYMLTYTSFSLYVARAHVFYCHIYVGDIILNDRTSVPEPVPLQHTLERIMLYVMSANIRRQRNIL
jgi:hypothetical protein